MMPWNSSFFPGKITCSSFVLSSVLSSVNPS
jgi:hypothetical protein